MALFYTATVTLGMTEADFWRATLRKLHALHSFHVDMYARRQAVRKNPLEQLL